MINRIIAALTRRLTRLRRKLEKQGGRGVALANEIDRIDFAVDALKGELVCPHCEAQLTGN